MDEKLYRIMNWPEIESIIYGEADHPEALLGAHAAGNYICVQTFQPGASEVKLLLPATQTMVPMEKADEDGYFAVLIAPEKLGEYRFEVTMEDGIREVREDPYRFRPEPDEERLNRFHAGVNKTIYELFGAHLTELNGTKGCLFTVWAPNALRVSVIGEFNHFDGRMAQMIRSKDGSCFSLFIPGIRAGMEYQYEILPKHGAKFVKADPYAFQQNGDGTCSIVSEVTEELADLDASHIYGGASGRPMNVCEVRLSDLFLTADEQPENTTLAKRLISYAKELHYTHVLLPGLMNCLDTLHHTPDMISYYAPSGQFGDVTEVREFISLLHQEGIGVLTEFRAGGFSAVWQGLSMFDGSPLYEPKEEARRVNQSDGLVFFDFTSREVRNYLTGAILYWSKIMGIDGFVFRNLGAILYLDFGRTDGRAFYNIYGETVNLEGVEFLQHLNAVMAQREPGILRIADDTTLWQNVTQPGIDGGLGFDMKYDHPFADHIVRYLHSDFYLRSSMGNLLTDDMLYHYTDEFILPLTHAKVGAFEEYQSLPGDETEKLGALKLLLGWQMTYPGRKIRRLQASVLQDLSALHKEEPVSEEDDVALMDSFTTYISELNGFYLAHPALYALDSEEEGFTWVDFLHPENGRLSFLRKGKNEITGEEELLFVVCNFTPTMSIKHIGVPMAGTYREIFHSDLVRYGGVGFTNTSPKKALAKKADGYPNSIKCNIAPLSIAIFKIDLQK